MERMCPSANVIVWKKDEKKRDDIEDLARARHHSKRFTTDILSESVVQYANRSISSLDILCTQR